MIYADRDKKHFGRKELGFEIAKLPNQVRRIDEHAYKVKSQSSENWYDVVAIESGWKCNCPDHSFRKICCKHIHAVEFSLKLRKEIKIGKIEPINIQSCIFCNSINFVKDAIRHNKSGDIQRYKCKECGKRFSINLGFEKMRANPQVITSAMQLYFTGESLRNVTKFLKLQGIEVSHVTVYKWIKKYIKLMESYLEQITPQVSDKWRADELFLKVKGNVKYLYALMDNDTRFWLAKQVSDLKFMADVRPMFRDGVKVAGKKPTVLITDGAHNFRVAHRKEYWSLANPRTIHIRHIHIKGDRNNNRMERLNGEIRDREKVMRSLKKEDSPLITGYQIFHNYFRPHMALENKTPAEVSGIKIQGDNKWITLIQNASTNKNQAL